MMVNSLERVPEGHLRGTAERLVESLDCPVGCTLTEIRNKVASAYGRPIVLVPVGDDELKTISGLWVETDDAGYVFFRQADPFVYQIHSIFHEFGHMLANDPGCEVLAVIDGGQLPSAGLGQQIRRARARGALQDEAELLAEEIAFTLSRVVLSGSSVGLRAVFE